MIGRADEVAQEADKASRSRSSASRITSLTGRPCPLSGSPDPSIIRQVLLPLGILAARGGPVGLTGSAAPDRGDTDAPLGPTRPQGRGPERDQWPPPVPVGERRRAASLLAERWLLR